jgi:hypothetical protein
VIGPMWRPSVHLLSDLLLHLQDLAQHLGLSGHEGLQWYHGRRWRQVTATGRSEPVGRAPRGSHHLKCEPLLDIYPESYSEMTTSAIMHNHSSFAFL